MKTALASLQDIGSWYDIPYAEKLKCLNLAVDKHPELGAEAARTAASLEKFHDNPRYAVFCDIQPLLEWLKGLSHPADLTLDVLTRATIVALSITTPMRLKDMYNMISTICVSHVSSESTHYFVTAKDKMGGMNTVRVERDHKGLSP